MVNAEHLETAASVTIVPLRFDETDCSMDTSGFDAVKHLVLCRIERLVARRRRMIDTQVIAPEPLIEQPQALARICQEFRV